MKEYLVTLPIKLAIPRPLHKVPTPGILNVKYLLENFFGLVTRNGIYKPFFLHSLGGWSSIVIG